MKKAVLYIVILGIVCTGLGIAVGIALNRIYTKRHLPRIIRDYYLSSNKEERRKIRRNQMVKWLRRELDLSNEQVNRIEDMMLRTEPEIDEFRRGLIGALVKIRRRIIEGISEVLEPEQRNKFQKLLRDRQGSWNKLMEE
jgi:Spy/CpxP family protein refolding chaperone